MVQIFLYGFVNMLCECCLSLKLFLFLFSVFCFEMRRNLLHGSVFMIILCDVFRFLLLLRFMHLLFQLTFVCICVCACVHVFAMLNEILFSFESSRLKNIPPPFFFQPRFSYVFSLLKLYFFVFHSNCSRVVYVHVVLIMFPDVRMHVP